jgi:hypothetical protein
MFPLVRLMQATSTVVGGGKADGAVAFEDSASPAGGGAVSALGPINIAHASTKTLVITPRRPNLMFMSFSFEDSGIRVESLNCSCASNLFPALQAVKNQNDPGCFADSD